MAGDDLRAQVEAFVRQDLQPFFDSLRERAALSDEEYWERMQRGLADAPALPEEAVKMLGEDFMSKENVLARRRQTDSQMQAVSETLVRTKVNRCLPFAEAVHAGSMAPLTRPEFEEASLQAAQAELEGIRERLKISAGEAGDDPRGTVVKHLSENAEIDVAALAALGDSAPMSEEAIREMAEEISARVARLTEEIRAGRIKKPDDA